MSIYQGIVRQRSLSAVLRERSSRGSFAIPRHISECTFPPIALHVLATNLSLPPPPRRERRSDDAARCLIARAPRLLLRCPYGFGACVLRNVAASAGLPRTRCAGHLHRLPFLPHRLAPVRDRRRRPAETSSSGAAGASLACLTASARVLRPADTHAADPAGCARRRSPSAPPLTPLPAFSAQSFSATFPFTLASARLAPPAPPPCPGSPPQPPTPPLPPLAPAHHRSPPRRRHHRPAAPVAQAPSLASLPASLPLLASPPACTTQFALVYTREERAPQGCPPPAHARPFGPARGPPLPRPARDGSGSRSAGDPRVSAAAHPPGRSHGRWLSQNTKAICCRAAFSDRRIISALAARRRRVQQILGPSTRALGIPRCGGEVVSAEQPTVPRFRDKAVPTTPARGAST
ncbi:uncharacterized protein SOCE836_009300 [Sorangium cellulosum]|uniref:Uncharacterized protein n=1 Tax=Sorangium cellulosum TaxID=56 RepID=A0A4P2QGB6_SORCE|nr:uncharacterized protein SOCE836_009300 [Sorangium cellulosum]WCQ88242.1 hypothetical protein NQZ70_00917 [Sorangium sp. Soce836]